MATQLFKITNGPSKLDLMLALFDPYPNGDARMLKFTAESERHREPESDHNHAFGSYKSLSREEQAEAEIYDLNIGPFDFELFIVGVKRLHDGNEWVISGQILDNNYWSPTDVGPIEVRFSTKSRKGSCEMDPMDYPDPKADCMMADVDLNPHMPMPWVCSWCKNSFADSVQPNQTFDGDTICHDCFRRDDEGPQIARIGINQYEAENEPERVVNEYGEVSYE